MSTEKDIKSEQEAKPKYPRKWEDVSTEYVNCCRLKVPNGWLVNVYTDENTDALTFYPDSNYEWILTDEKI